MLPNLIVTITCVIVHMFPSKQTLELLADGNLMLVALYFSVSQRYSFGSQLRLTTTLAKVSAFLQVTLCGSRFDNRRCRVTSFILLYLSGLGTGGASKFLSRLQSSM